MRKNKPAIRVKGSAAAAKNKGLTPSPPKEGLKMPYPTGLGALAITVSPPPVTAPATKRYREIGRASCRERV